MPRYGAIACEVLEVVPPDPETFDRMGPGWRDVVVPRLADLVAALD